MSKVGVFGPIRDQLYALFQSPPRLRPVLRIERECRVAIPCRAARKREDDCTVSDGLTRLLFLIFAMVGAGPHGSK